MRVSLIFLFSIVLIQTQAQTQTWLSKEEVELSHLTTDKPHLSNLQCFEVTYLSDENVVKGILLEPRKVGVYPAIVFNRGGNREFAVLSSEMIISVLGRVASEGYVITASNYRWDDEYGGADTNDVLNLLDITRSLPNVDSNRIGMMGWSRGAMMTCLTLKGTHDIKSTVLVSGAPSLYRTIKERPALEETVFSRYIPNYEISRENALRARSAYFWAEELDRGTSLLILNGTKDRHVDYRQSEDFSKRLDSLGFPHQFQLYETNHSFSNMRPKLDSILLNWFNKTLKQGRKRVAFTIDDVPNTRNFKKNGFNSKLLNELDSLSIAVTIFINEGLIYRSDSLKNKELLKSWIMRPYVTPANHTYAHSRYSQVGFDQFTADVLKGEMLSKDLALEYNKELKYFRFPYNDLGKDSSEHVLIEDFLRDKDYISTPFSIETSDWMFNAIYRNYLKEGNEEMAAQIGEMYVDETIRSFAFFDSLMKQEYGRNVDQIYLCHDNRLNEDYLPILIDRLEREGYEFISLDKAMSDPVYAQEDTYWKKWGISWCYRWMTSSNRKKWMYLEPDLGGIEEIYMEETNKK